MSNLVSLTCPRLKILDKTQTGVFPISAFIFKFLIKKNCHNSRTSNDAGMKTRTLTELGKGNTPTSKMTSLQFFRFMADLKRCGTRLPKAWSMILTFSFIATFHLIKSENRIKKYPTKLSQYCSHNTATAKRTSQKPTQIRIKIVLFMSCLICRKYKLYQSIGLL